MISDKIIEHEGKQYKVTEQIPDWDDLVITEEYGVWVFRNYGTDECPAAPMPYWANPRACKKLELIN